MSQYTEADYRREYAELERKEQESQKQYNDWFMNMKMGIQTYNNIVKENQLEDTFSLIDDSDESIKNLDKESIKAIYERIVAFKKEVTDKIERGLGLSGEAPSEGAEPQAEPQVETTQQSEDSDLDNSGFDFSFGAPVGGSSDPLAEWGV